jgi:hypothetical protein
MPGAVRPVTDGAAREESFKPLRDVLESLGAELDQARALGLRVEGAICQIAVRSAIDPAVVAELQQLDMVLQQMGNLRAFIAKLALECEGKGGVSIEAALDQVTLAAVRSRLAGANEDDLSDEEGWEIL